MLQCLRRPDTGSGAKESRIVARCPWLFLAALLAPAVACAIDNDYVTVTRDAAPCAAGAAAGCGDRVIVALGEVELRSGATLRRLTRGDVAVFGAGEPYAAPTGSYFEVAIKPDHPASDSPGEMIAPQKNASIFDGEDFFVFEEKLAPGDTRARHSHSQRVVIQLNRTKLRQWPDGKPEIEVETRVDEPRFSPPVIHVVENIGEVPLRGVIVEFKPGEPGAARPR
jgi:hypothetical protein